MTTVFFRRIQSRFEASGLRAAFTPRKPRNPLLRVLLGLLGIALLLVLLVVGLVVGTAMLAIGLVGSLLGRRARPAAAAPGNVVDAEYRVVPKTGPQLLR